MAAQRRKHAPGEQLHANPVIFAQINKAHATNELRRSLGVETRGPKASRRAGHTTTVLLPPLTLCSLLLFPAISMARGVTALRLYSTAAESGQRGGGATDDSEFDSVSSREMRSSLLRSGRWEKVPWHHGVRAIRPPISPKSFPDPARFTDDSADSVLVAASALFGSAEGKEPCEEDAHARR